MKRIAVILSGCGFKDGAEITESVCTFLALSEKKAAYIAFGIDKNFQSINHTTDKTEDKRNALSESSRIYRKPVMNLKELKVDDFDALILPGGFGAALHLCNFAEKGFEACVDEDMKKIIKEFYEKSKPVGAFCIAPVLLALVLGHEHVSITIGNDKSVIENIEKTGARHVECRVDDFVTDRENKIVTSPAYMYSEALPFEVYTGIKKAVSEIFEMA